jgi:hypothetical protein
LLGSFLVQGTQRGGLFAAATLICSIADTTANPGIPRLFLAGEKTSEWNTGTNANDENNLIRVNARTRIFGVKTYLGRVTAAPIHG